MLKPRCLIGKQTFGFTNSEGGYILPCCWCDQPERTKEFASLTQEKFKITNVDSIESILESDEWQDFFDILMNRHEEAPDTCKTYCSSDFIHKKVNYSKGNWSSGDVNK